MTFGQSIKTCFSKYVTFSGRAGRAEYWWFFLFNFLLGMIPIVGALASLALFLPMLAVSWRRLHDIGRSGWWGILPYVIATVIIGFGAAMESDIVMGIGGVAFLGAVILVIVWLASRGEDGPNRFGSDPRGESMEEVFA